MTQDRRGWNSEFAKPYKPLGVPKLDLAAPKDILRQRENVQKSFGQGAVAKRSSSTNTSSCISLLGLQLTAFQECIHAGRHTTSANGRQSEKINNLLLHSNRSTGREVMHTASDDMQQRIKVACH